MTFSNSSNNPLCSRDISTSNLISNSNSTELQLNRLRNTVGIISLRLFLEIIFKHKLVTDQWSACLEMFKRLVHLTQSFQGFATCDDTRTQLD